jgi:hypothetical protein
LKKKVKTPKVAQKPGKIIVLKYWLQNTALKKIGTNRKKCNEYECDFSNFKDFV